MNGVKKRWKAAVGAATPLHHTENLEDFQEDLWDFIDKYGDEGSNYGQFVKWESDLAALFVTALSLSGGARVTPRDAPTLSDLYYNLVKVHVSSPLRKQQKVFAKAALAVKAFYMESMQGPSWEGHHEVEWTA